MHQILILRLFRLNLLVIYSLWILSILMVFRWMSSTPRVEIWFIVEYATSVMVDKVQLHMDRMQNGIKINEFYHFTMRLPP
jgi:hypothetical protein